MPNNIKPKQSSWHVYILRCFDNTLYTGITNDISKRLARHNAKVASAYTRVRTPVTVVYQEPHNTRSSASKREAQIKRWSREKKLALVSGDVSKLRDLSKSRD